MSQKKNKVIIQKYAKNYFAKNAGPFLVKAPDN